MTLQLLLRPINNNFRTFIKPLQSRQNLCLKVNQYSNKSAMGAKPFEVSGNLAKDTLIYKYANPVFFRNMTIFGFAQFVFWSYLMGFTYTTLRDVNPEEESKMLGLDKDSLPWWRRINLGGNLYRNGLASLCGIFGFSVLGISLLYPSRAVKSLHLLKGGQQVRVKTYSILKNSKDFITNLETISCLHSRSENKPQIAMKIQGRWLFFMLDKRGRFYEEDIFDYVIGLRRNI